MITVHLTHWTGVRHSYRFDTLAEALTFAWRFYRPMAMLRSIADGVDAACATT